MAAAVEVPTAETTGHAPPTEADVVIVGSGFSGLGTAIRLKKEGFEDFVVLERGDEVGGTWWFNTYPGCACDVQSHLYSFSFAPNPDWSENYSIFFFSSRRRHTRSDRDWSSDVCSSDLAIYAVYQRQYFDRTGH